MFTTILIRFRYCPFYIITNPNQYNILSHSIQPPSPRLPHPHHLHRHQKPRAHRNHAPRKRLRALIPTTAINNGPCNRRPRQRRKAHNRKHHAHPDPRLAQIRRQERQRRGEQALDARAQHPVTHGPDVETRRGGDGHPCEEGDGRDERNGDEEVDGAYAVGDVVGDDAADVADAVEDEEEVEGGGVAEGRVDLGAREGCEVVEGKVDAPEALSES